MGIEHKQAQYGWSGNRPVYRTENPISVDDRSLVMVAKVMNAMSDDRGKVVKESSGATVTIQYCDAVLYIKKEDLFYVLRTIRQLNA